MTEADKELTGVSFHDVGLLKILHTGSIVTLALEDVPIGGVPKAAKVTIDGVTAVLRNGSPVSNLLMEKQAGEILTLREESGQILLAIQWDDFAAKAHEVVAYTLSGSKIALRVTLAAS